MDIGSFAVSLYLLWFSNFEIMYMLEPYRNKKTDQIVVIYVWLDKTTFWL